MAYTKNHSLQILRAVASTMVILAHLIERLVKYELVDPRWEEATRLGAKGVDIFFVISGFIVGSAYLNDRMTGGQPMAFFKRRFFRIAPAYYFWSCLMVVKLVLVDKQTVGTLILLTSAAFLPHLNDAGLIQPIYGLGWSLNFEMYFYAVLAIGLLVSNKSLSLLVIFLMVASPVIWVHLTSNTDKTLGATFKFYGMPVALFFLAGFSIALIKARVPLISLPRSVFANAMFCVLLSITAVLTIGYASVLFTCACVFFAAYSVNEVRPAIRVIRYGSFLGDASYSTYLTHSFILGPAVAIYRATVVNPNSISSIVCLIILSVSVSVVVGAVAYLYVEKWLDNFVKSAITLLSMRRRV